MDQVADKSHRVAISLEMEWGFKRHVEMYAGCQRYADEVGWESFINPSVEAAFKTKEPWPYDGVLARVTQPMGDLLLEKGVPVVNVWMNSPVKGLPSVYPDFEATGIMAAEHILSRGFKQFGYLGYVRDIDSRLQYKGFEGVANREGFPCSDFRVSRTSLEGRAPGWDEFISRLEKWVDTWEPPIGVFVTSDTYCRYLIDVCRSKGLHVSQEVAILGTMNETVICNSPPPTLTSIDLGYARIGYRAAEILDDLMHGRSVPEEPVLVAPSELAPRQSTSSFAADDPLVARALRFISDNGQERIQVKDVVEAVSTNRRTLERKFRSSVGRSIAGEITRLRLERAKRRMVETDSPMKLVAQDAGFRSSDHFYKVFMRIEGIPPTQYRDERRKMFPKEDEV